ncbi:MAG: ABC transporter permease, partial [Bacteroidota bacterium]
MKLQHGFIGEKLAEDLSERLNTRVVPLIQTEGMVVNSEKNLRINRVQVNGIDGRFSELWGDHGRSPGKDEVVISRNVAEKLELKAGDELVLRMAKPGRISQNAPFSSDKSIAVQQRLKVIMITDDDTMGRFNLDASQTAPFNIFISLGQAESRLGLKGLVNILLLPEQRSDGSENINLDSLIRKVWQLQDVGLKIKRSVDSSGIEITSDRIFFSDKEAKFINSSLQTQSVFTWLANSISSDYATTPYSFVTAGNPLFLQIPLDDNEIIINDWLAQDLKVKRGDSLQLRYFLMGPLKKLIEDSCRFIVKTVIAMNDPRCDRSLMPDFPGMSDAGNCRDWETGTPIDLKKIRKKDEQYWKDFRGTPKAFLALKKGQKLWKNQFGVITSFRIKQESNKISLFGTGSFSKDPFFTAKAQRREENRSDIQSLASLRLSGERNHGVFETVHSWSGTDSLSKLILQKLTPSDYGLRFRDVYQEGMNAAAQSTDFGSLFLSLSFFIIFSGLLLTSMLFSLHLGRRMSGQAVFAALGFTKRQQIIILLKESILVILFSGLLGALTGIGCTRLILLGLNSFWGDAVRTSSLEIWIDPVTLFTGALAGMLLSVFVVVLVVYRQLKNPLSILIKGRRDEPIIFSSKKTHLRIALGLFLFFSGLAVSIFLIGSSEYENTNGFLLSGALLLLCGISLFTELIALLAERMKIHNFNFIFMVLRNLSANKNRMTGTIALLSIGIFVIVITGANQRSFDDSASSRGSGTGGFLFWAETTVPVLHDLNTESGKKQYSIEGEKDLKHVRFQQMTRVNGDDASCLNLNRVSKPAILGVDIGYLDSVGAFTLSALDHSVNPDAPWMALRYPLSERIIPAFADLSVIQWGLGKKVGDTIEYLDESGRALRIKLMGGLDNSIFQGYMIISDSLLRSYYPSASGSHIMLVDGKKSSAKEVVSTLENAFRDFGMMVTPASERLSLFHSVQNTYLSVFMILGGLGVVIGTFGMGFFILVNILGRGKEIAIYMAIGFRKRRIFSIFLTEFFIL